MSIDVRPEDPRDFAAVRSLVARAFTDAEHSAPPVEADGAPGETTLVGWLRNSPAHDPRFALTAQDGADLVGFAMATWGRCGGEPVLGVGPVAVDPAKQGEGIGSRLMTALVERATDAGQPALVLLGDPEFYSRFGFVPASRLGIAGEPEWGAFFQAVPLGDGGVVTPDEYRGPRGSYEYAEPFSRLG